MNRDLQEICELGQQQLMRMEYLQAEASLAEAERGAWEKQDWDALGRLYLPLQEARRQRRQRCGEGIVCLDLLADGAGADRQPRAEKILEQYPHGQLLVAGWGSIAPAVELRRLLMQRPAYVETFLAAVYPVHESRLVVIVPTTDVSLPPIEPGGGLDRLLSRLPAHSITIDGAELGHGDTQTYARVMELWERLHGPFLAEADSITEPVAKMEGYRRTIRVDYACELAHQKLAETARRMRIGR